jgi:hypothetical protein
MSAVNEGEEYDEYLAQLASRIGNVEGVLQAFLGFLHRKTDFYVEYSDKEVDASYGFAKGAAENILLKAFRKFPMKSYSDDLKCSDSPTKEPPNSRFGEGKCIEANSPVNDLITCRTNEIGQQIPIGNGGIGPNYYWTQTLKDITLYVEVPSDCKGKDIKCTIHAKSLSLAVRGEIYLDGELEETIRVDESMWTLNIDAPAKGSSSQVVIALEKIRPTWWKHVIVGHPEIDTTKVGNELIEFEYLLLIYEMPLLFTILFHHENKIGLAFISSFIVCNVMQKHATNVLLSHPLVHSLCLILFCFRCYHLTPTSGCNRSIPLKTLMNMMKSLKQPSAR